MKTIRRFIAPVPFLAVATISLFAQSGGAITGRVSHAATGANLEGAEVSLAGLASVLTARDGSFVIPNVPRGTHAVRVRYTGLGSSTKTVEIAASLGATVDFSLSSGVTLLGAYTVTSAREGEAASITKQRNAPNVVNVVAIETFGDVADGNLGNFMVRLPGVAAEETSNGDIIGIKIRGTPAELNSVNLDGVRVSNAVSGFSPMGDRATMIDQLPAEFIKEVEVHKALTPQMPADAIGGATNLITKSALDFKESVFTYKLGASFNTYRDSLRTFKPTATLSYLTTVGRERPIGITLSLSYSVTETPRDRVQVARADLDGRMSQARTLAEVNTRERAGAGLKLEYRLTAATSVAAKFNYALYHYEGLREIAAANATGNRREASYARVSRAQIETGASPLDAAGLAAGVAPGFSEAFTELLNAAFTNEFGRAVRYGRNYLGEVSGEHRFGAGQKLTMQASYNPSWFDADLPTLVTTLTNGTTTAAAGIGMVIDGRQNRSRPRFAQSYGPRVAFPSNVNLYTGVYSTSRGRTEEEIANVQADYTKEFGAREQPVQLKAGVNWRSQHRWVFTSAKSWRVVGADGVAMRNAATGQSDDLAVFRESGPGYGLFNHQYPQRDKFDILAVERAAVSNPAWFAPTAAFAPPTINEATEDVYAAYLQGRIRLGKLAVLGGVRAEKTEIEASGRLTDSRQPAAARIERKGGYRDYFPSVHFTYEFRRQLVARASYSTGASRPGLNNLYPITTVSYDASALDGTVTQNDPGLKPQYAKNYDVSLEYYFEPAGVLSFGLFRKDLTDFLAREIRVIGSGADNGFAGLYAGFDHSTTTNQGSAKIQGWEFNYMQQLTMLPQPFDRLQVFANWTELETRGRYASGAEELAKFTPRTTNVGLAYQWRSFHFRITQRYTGDYLDGYNANAWQRTRFRSDEKLDISLKYQFHRRFAAYCDVLNVGDKWPDQYQGRDQSRVLFSNVYGTKINFGLNGRY